MTAPSIRVLLVDDHPLVREGLRQVLGPPAFEVIGEAGTGEEGIDLAVRHRPDVVVLDINLPGQNGIEVAEILRHRVPARERFHFDRRAPMLARPTVWAQRLGTEFSVGREPGEVLFRRTRPGGST